MQGVALCLTLLSQAKPLLIHTHSPLDRGLLHIWFSKFISESSFFFLISKPLCALSPAPLLSVKAVKARFLEMTFHPSLPDFLGQPVRPVCLLFSILERDLCRCPILIYHLSLMKCPEPPKPIWKCPYRCRMLPGHSFTLKPEHFVYTSFS